MAGVKGMVFNDKNTNGILDAGESYDAVTDPLTQTHATLTGSNGLLNITINADGSFSSLTTGGTPYYLKAGSYTLTVYDDNTQGGFTPTTSATASVNVGTTTTPIYNWYMDIEQPNIAFSQVSAIYSFSVYDGMDGIHAATLSTQLVGVGLHDASLVTYQAGTGASFTMATEYRNYNQNPTASVVPIVNADQGFITGYNPETVLWKADVPLSFSSDLIFGDAVLPAGSTISAGAPLTRAQLLQAKITQPTVFTTSLQLNRYTVTFVGNNNSSGTMADTPNIPHGSDVSPITANAYVRAGYSFVDWQASGADTGTYADGATINNITGDITLTAQWNINFYELTYDLNDGGDVTYPAALGSGGAPTDSVVLPVPSAELITTRTLRQMPRHLYARVTLSAVGISMPLALKR
jgi:uncharacterized repeat protein (TIGR02543 family)